MLREVHLHVQMGEMHRNATSHTGRGGVAMLALTPTNSSLLATMSSTESDENRKVRTFQDKISSSKPNQHPTSSKIRAF
jgi:hypothetical protein